MNPTKITLLSIFTIIVLFLLFAALYDMARCLHSPETYYRMVVSQYIPGSPIWYLDLFRPNLIVIAFCIPKFIIMHKFSSASNTGSIWNPIFYLALSIVVIAGTLAIVEIFDTPDIEIIQNA